MTGFIDIIKGEINSTVAATVILLPIIANKMFGIALLISEPYYKVVSEHKNGNLKCL